MRTLRPSGASVNGEQRPTLQSHATSVPLPAGTHLNGRLFHHWMIPRPLAQTRSSNIRDGAVSPASRAKPTAAPSGAEVELQDTAVPIGTEVLHVYSTGLNGSLPLFTYVAHMDLVCPRCMPKQTCPVHRLGLMLSISSSAGAYLMKMGTGAGVKCLLP